MMVNAMRYPTSNMRPMFRAADCAACCCLSSTQIDRSLCTTMMCVGTSSTTCAFRRRIAQGNSQELHVAVVVAVLAESSRSIACTVAARGAHPNGDGLMTEIGDGYGHACAGSVTSCAISCRKPRPGRAAGASHTPLHPSVRWSPLSMSRSSRNGSALGGAEAPCRIAL